MERYSTLYGTNLAGEYGRLGSSPKLKAFLEQRVGAADAATVIEMVQEVVRPQPFATYEDHFRGADNDRPLAIRYAPMHLYKKPNIPDTMRQFCAIGVSGLENRADTGRMSWYTHTHMFPVNLMRATGGITYLDQLFGTVLTTHRDMERLRSGKRGAVRLDMEPDQVNPVIRRDLNPVIRAVQALYQEKNVLICLEPGVSFNTRAKDILMQVYSLLHPRLATEVGYATYQSIREIPRLCDETSIRIFVVPAGVKPELPERLNFEVIDLGEEAKPLERNEFREVMGIWAGMRWQERQPMMERLFANVEKLWDVELFVALSKGCFAAQQKKKEWVAEHQKRFTSLVEIATAEKAAGFWQDLPDPKGELRKALPTLLAEGVTMEQLNAMAAADAQFAPEGKKKGEQQRLRYGLSLGGVDPVLLVEEVSKRQKQADAEQVQPRIDALNAEHASAMTAAQTAHEKAMEEKDAAHKTALETKEASCAKRISIAMEARDAAIREGAERLQAEQEARRIDAETAKAALEAEQQAHETDLTAAKEQRTRELAAFKEKLDGVVARYKLDLEDKDRQLQAADLAHQKAMTEQTLRHQREEAQWRTQTEDLNGQITGLGSQIAGLNVRLGQAETLARSLEQEKTALSARVGSVTEQLDQAMARGRELEQDKRDLENEKTALVKENAQLRKASGGMEAGGEVPAARKNNLVPTVLAAVAGLAVGALLMWGGMALFGGGNANVQPPETTLPPVSTTTAPPETTLPPETTVPSTTVPPTTLPPETEPPEEPIQWELVQASCGLTEVQTRQTIVAWMLRAYDLNPEEQLAAVMTDDPRGFGQSNVLPQEFMVLIRKDVPKIPQTEQPTAPAETTEPTESTAPEETTEPRETKAPVGATVPGGETEPEKALAEEAGLILEGREYRLLVIGGEVLQEKAWKVFALICPEETGLELTWTGEGEQTLALGELLAQVLDGTPWWTEIQGISEAEAVRSEGQAALDSSRTPVAAVKLADQTVYVYDYTDDPAKGEWFLDIQKHYQRTAAMAEGLLAVCVDPV